MQNSTYCCRLNPTWRCGCYHSVSPSSKPVSHMGEWRRQTVRLGQIAKMVLHKLLSLVNKKNDYLSYIYSWHHHSIVPRRPPFYLPFAFTIIHGSGRQTKNVLTFWRYSNSMYYCEHKGKIKTGEAWDRGYTTIMEGRGYVIISLVPTTFW